ncbi:hypothetical protein FRC12_006580 [Ceratobasidium sp. 428]|nr:hypothetical protein FRC12_006580 [Ceratobasidium sp. 428]
MSTNSSATHSRVFETPELLDAICGAAKRSTCLALLCVNKSSFHAAAPFVWNKVTRVTHLLKLISTVTIPLAASHGAVNIVSLHLVSKEVVLIYFMAKTLPPFASADFSRFTVYAPYVRSLDVHSDVSVSPWRTLVLRAKQQPLLPRLLSLTVWQENRKDPITKELMWMSVLLTQSVTSVRVQSSHTIGMGFVWGVSVILHVVATSCPHVRRLTLPTISEGTEETDGEHYLLNLFPNQPVSKSFLAFSSLHTLVTGLWIFRDDYLRVLGSLPRLRYLKLIPGYPITDSSTIVSYLDNSFPALERLCMEDLSWKDARIVLGHGLLVKNLVSLKLVLEYAADTLTDMDSTFLMLKGIDGLTDLDVDFGNSDELYEIEPSDMVLSVLSQLSLHTVRLSFALLLKIVEIDLYQVFSAITELRMPNQYTAVHEFQVFAALPRLQHLAVTFCDSATIDQVTDNETTACPSLNILEFANQIDDPFELYPQHIKPTARYLFRLFPNVKPIRWSIVGMYGSDTDNLCLTLSNVCIGMIRKRNNLRASVAERYGWDVASRLLPGETNLGI